MALTGMALTGRESVRKSYIPLSTKPINHSLTTGLNIPAPLHSPPESPTSFVRPPTPGGGPLTSHPTTPDNRPGAFPPTPEPEKGSGSPYELMANDSMAHENRWQPPRKDSFRTPTSPASATSTQTATSTQNTTPPMEPPRRPSTGRPSTSMRKLLSLSSLRSSFNNSRTSLHLSSNDTPNYTTGIKRPSSPSVASTRAPSYQQPEEQRPELRTRKSASGWFRRKSGMFMVNTDNNLQAVDENQRPDTRESKRMRESSPAPAAKLSPAPILPEIGAFGGGDMGWDEQLFKG